MISKLDNLKNKLDETIDIININKIFSENNKIIEIKEESQSCKDLKKQYSLENILGSLFKEKISDFILFSQVGHLIILLENNQTYIHSVNNFKTVRITEQKGWFSKKYILNLDENKSVYIPKDCIEILKSLMSTYSKYSFEEINKKLVEKNNLQTQIYDELKEIRINGSDICLSLFEKYKDEGFVLDKKTLRKYIVLTNTWDDGVWEWTLHKGRKYFFGLNSGVFFDTNEFSDSTDINFIYFYYKKKYDFQDDKWEYEYFSVDDLSLSKIDETIHEINDDSIVLKYKVFNKTEKRIIKLSHEESKFMKELIDNFKKEIYSKYRRIESENFENEKQKNEKIKKEKERKKKLKSKTKSILDDFDKDKNGIIDFIENEDDFMSLFRKHQDLITKNNSEHILKFVHVYNYLKTKRENIQLIFSKLNNVKSENELKNSVGILKNEIHTYKLLLLHSINMIMSLLENDQITFYEIYVSFDKLNMFNSNWENDVSKTLNKISDKLTILSSQLNRLLYSVEKMNRSIVKELRGLQYITSESFGKLEKNVIGELKSINSSMNFNNLLTGIQTYQMYKVNKNTKSLK